MFLFESFATVYCTTVHMFPTIKQLSVRQSYTNGTRINLCQQTRAHRPDSLCGLVQSLCSILPPHTQVYISTVSDSVSALRRWRWIEKCPVCISVCTSLRVGPAPFDHWAAAYPPAGFAVSSAKKNSTGFRPGEAISCCLMCVRECLWVCGLACRCMFQCVLLHIYVHVFVRQKECESACVCEQKCQGENVCVDMCLRETAGCIACVIWGVQFIPGSSPLTLSSL